MHVVDGRPCGAASLHAPGVGTAQPFEHGDNIAACHIETHPGIGLVGDRGAGAESGGQGRGVDPFNQILVRPIQIVLAWLPPSPWPAAWPTA